MTVLMIENHDQPSDGEVGNAIRQAGVPVEVFWGEKGHSIPENTGGYDALVILGGAMAVDDEERCPYIPDLIRLIRDFGQADKPVLGVCLGAQLVARAYGAEPRLDGYFELGYCPVRLTEAGKKDQVVGHMLDDQAIFQWHTDHYTLPPDAVHLATGDDHPYQCFKMGRATYAMQFHFEVTRPIIESWIALGIDNITEHHPAFIADLPIQFGNHLESVRDFCHTAIHHWLALRKS